MQLLKNIKNFFLISLLGVSGCVSSFDYNEQKALTDLRFLTKDLKICGDPGLAKYYVDALKNTSDWLVLYSDNTSDKQLKLVYKNIKESVDEISAKYHSTQAPSIAYCENKLTNIKQMADRAASTAAGRS